MTSAETSAPAPSASPVCAKHPDLAAMAPCSRCGTFACDKCIAGRVPPMCQACFDSYNDPMGVKQVPYSYGSAIAGGMKLAVGAFVPALLISLPFGAADHVIGMLTGDSLDGAARFGWILSGLVAILADTARIRLFGHLSNGESPQGGESLGYAFKNFGRMWVINFRAGITIFFYLLALIVPGVIKALRLSLRMEEAVLGDFGDPNARSEELTRGRLWSLLGLFTTLWVVRLTIVFVMSFMSGAAGEIAPGAVMPLDIASSLFSTVAEVFISAISVAAYFGLRRDEQARA